MMKKAPAPRSYTIGELIFSIVMVSIGALALATSFVEFRQTEAASVTTTSLVKLEQTLSMDLVRGAAYEDESTKIALRTGAKPSALKFALASGVFIRPGETVFLDRSLHACTGYPIGDCGFKVRLSLGEHPPAFAYEVASSFPEAALSLSRSGRNEVVIPRSFYRDPHVVVCDPRREVGLTGLVSGDRYDCIGRPLKSCPRGTLPKALAVDATTGSLELDCGSPSSVARCPAFYSLASVDTRTLDAIETKEVRCVRTTASVALPSVQPIPALRHVGRACPTGYRSESSCTLVNVKEKAGRCGAGVARPVPGRLRFVENKPTGNVDCGVDLQAQTCGAIWMGYAQLRVKCILDQPEFANAL